MQPRKLLALFAYYLLLLAPVAFAQSTNASLSGEVTDIQGLVIVGADVQAVNQATGVIYESKTNGTGLYWIPDLPPGSYEVRISKTGFRTMLRPDVSLNVQDSRSLNATLQVGDAAEIVRVEGGISLVNTQDASVSTTIDRNFAENLPLNGRSFQTLLLLTPGTTIAAQGSDGGTFSVNGERANTNNFTVDGMSVNLGGALTGPNGSSTAFFNGANPDFTIAGTTQGMVSVDALQEFKIQTSTYAPEFGRQPGGQVSVLTRSGTNNFHGTAFDYLRNDIFDANNWFNDATIDPATGKSLPKGKERQNDFGGTLGGPIFRDKTFFFFSYEGLRLLQPFTEEQGVPSLQLRQAAAPAFQSILNSFPIPNGPVSGNGAIFTLDASQPTDFDSYAIKIDHTFGRRLSLFGRYSHTSSGQDPFYAFASTDSPQRFTSQGLTLGTDMFISPNLTNELRLNYTVNPSSLNFRHNSVGGGTPFDTSILFPKPLTDGVDAASWNLQLPGIRTAIPVGPTANNTQRQIQTTDNFSYSIGSHSVKLGVDYRRLLPTFVYYPAKVDYTVSSMADLTAGTLSQTRMHGFTVTHPIYTNFSAYAQDTWRVAKRLTLTYGLRWELNPTPGERDGLNKYILNVIGLNNPATATLAPSGAPIYKTTYTNFVPRVGLAYQLRQSPGREMVLRVGVGTFSDLNSQGIASFYAANAFANNAPPISGLSFPVGANVLSIPPVPVLQAPPFFFIAGVDPNLQLPYAVQWNVSIEQALGRSQSLTASYVASSGQQLLREDVLTNFSPTFQNVNAIQNSSSSSYQSLQLQFNRRLSGGFQALASYTYSHSIDNASSGQSIITSFAGGALPDPNVDRGSSDFDQRHAFRGAITYNLPAWNRNFFSKAVFGGWSVDAIGLAQSGLPVDLAGAWATNYFATVRPDLVAGQPLYLYGAQCSAADGGIPCPGGSGFNPAAFVSPPADSNGFALRQGTLGRNVLRGLGAWQADFALHRQFNLAEQVHLQFRGEFFNIFNHPNFAGYDNFVGDTTFGQSTSTLNQSLGGLNQLYQIGGPRSIQLALKLNF